MMRRLRRRPDHAARPVRCGRRQRLALPGDDRLPHHNQTTPAWPAHQLKRSCLPAKMSRARSFAWRVDVSPNGYGSGRERAEGSGGAGPVLEPWAARVWEELSADGRRRSPRCSYRRISAYWRLMEEGFSVLEPFMRYNAKPLLYATTLLPNSPFCHNTPPRAPERLPDHGENPSRSRPVPPAMLTRDSTRPNHPNSRLWRGCEPSRCRWDCCRSSTRSGLIASEPMSVQCVSPDFRSCAAIRSQLSAIRHA